MTRVLLVDDHALVRAGLHALLNSIPGVQVVAEADNGAAALELVATHLPDVVLMDVAMEVMNGLEATIEIKRRFPAVRIIILSMFINEAYIDQALRAGATGYLVKDSETADIERALEAVAAGEIYLGPRVSTQLVQSYLKCSSQPVSRQSAPDAAELSQLTARQSEVLKAIADGWATKEIAHNLGISPKTVEAHRMQLMERLGIRDVAGLVRYAIRIGLVTLDT